MISKNSKAGSRRSILLIKNVAFVNVNDCIENRDKNIDVISKIRHWINNLTDHQKYQIGFVIFDAESNFEHIYRYFSLFLCDNSLLGVFVFRFSVEPFNSLF